MALACAPAGAQAAETPNYSNYVLLARFANDVSDGDEALKGQFAAIKAAHDDNSANAAGGVTDNSLKAYLRSISRGKLIVKNYFPQQGADGAVALLDLPMTFTEYVEDVAQQEPEIIRTAIAWLDENANISACAPDLNGGGGILDNLTIVIQTAGYVDGTENDEMITAHKSTHLGDETFRGYKVGDYNIHGSSSIVLPSGVNPSVIIHEFLHSVGLQDLYRKDGSGTPVGGWDVMADTPLWCPPYPLAYNRYVLGYVPLTTVTEAGRYTIGSASSDTDPIALRFVTPVSGSEHFIVEYRRRQEGDFDNIIAENGLLIYRVNTAETSQSNYYDGNDYIYVFRPDPSYLNDAESIKVTDAALDPAKGETSFGSTDMDKSYAENTIYCSDGQNSGIAISNIEYTDNGETISFDVAFADYETAGLWSMSYADTEAATTAVDICTDDAGNVYAAYAGGSGTATAVKVLKKTGEGWVQQGGAISGASMPEIRAYGGSVYLSCLVNFCPAAYRLSAGGAWEQIYQDTAAQYAAAARLYGDDSGLLMYYVKDNTTLVLYDLVNRKVVNNSLTASGQLSNPEVCRLNGSLYALYLDYPLGFGTTSAGTQLKKLGAQGWESIPGFTGPAYSNCHRLAADGTRLYILAGDYSTYNFAILSGDNLIKSETLPFLSSSASASLIYSRGLYLSFVGGENSEALVYKYGDGGFAQFGGRVAAGAAWIETAKSGGEIYAAMYANAAKPGLYIRQISDASWDGAAGDVNMDGEVSLPDVICAAHIVARLEHKACGEYNPDAADVNGDGAADASDLVLIARYIVGLNETLP